MNSNRQTGRNTPGSPEVTACATNQGAQAALRERVKELTCLYGIAQAAERPQVSLEEILEGIVKLLPPAWQYPEIAFARIVLDGRSFSAPGFQEGGQKQSADIVVNGEHRGVVETWPGDIPELLPGIRACN